MSNKCAASETNAGFFFNPGSVGLAYSHHQPDAGFQADPWAEYAVLTSEGQRSALEFRRLPIERSALHPCLPIQRPPLRGSSRCTIQRAIVRAPLVLFTLQDHYAVGLWST